MQCTNWKWFFVRIVLILVIRRKHLILPYILLGFNIYTPPNISVILSQVMKEIIFLLNKHSYLIPSFFIFWQSIMSVLKVSWRLFYCVHKRVFLYVRRMIRLSGSLILFLRNEKICFWTNIRNNVYFNHLSNILQQVLLA